MCQRRHEIFVTNFNNGDVIEHELLLVKGLIHQKCPVSAIYLTTEGSNSPPKKFNISTSGEFKALLLLAEGLNQFQLNYCHASFKITCVHKKTISSYKVQPLYLICKNHDGCFQSTSEHGNSIDDACKIITLGLKLVQCLYSEKVLENCNVQGTRNRKTFSLQSDCVPFYAKLDVAKAQDLDESSLWNEFAYEILNSEIGANENLKFVAFIGCTRYEGITDGDYSYSNIKKHTKAHAALGGGGLALFGSAGLYTWPTSVDNIISCFENNYEIDLKNCWDDSNYRRTFGGCFATTFGAVCHEIGHIFDLGHTNDGIMGNGFDYVNRVFTINNLTEVLPDRLVDTKSQIPIKDRRLTQLKKPDKFLAKYYEQKSCDGTYFTESCALILFFHKWLNKYQWNSVSNINLDKSTNLISSNIALKVIEVREKTNGLVVEFLDLSSKDCKKVKLKRNVDYCNYDVFVITADGTTKLFN